MPALGEGLLPAALLSICCDLENPRIQTQLMTWIAEGEQTVQTSSKGLHCLYEKIQGCDKNCKYTSFKGF